MAVVDQLTVKMWGRTIGYLVWDNRSNCADFQYEEDFLPGKREISPLTMPLSNAVYRFGHLARETFQGLPGCFSDSLPDKFGNRLIEEWMIRNKRSSLTPLEKLSFIGNRGMGCLEYEPSNNIKSKSTQIELSSLVHVAREILNTKSKLGVQFDDLSSSKEKALRELISIGTSAGGARAKALIAYDEVKGEIRSGQVTSPKRFKYYLIKFDGISQSDKEGADPQGFGIIEYVYHLMAKKAGIEMAKCQLFEENNRKHFMTQRFDRLAGGEKLHMQSLCAMGHHDFNQARTTSYEQALDTCRKLNLTQKEVLQLYKRMVFNVVARNQDDHTKNISFLMDKSGTWSLAPAYNVCYSYSPDGAWTSAHQMTVNGKSDKFVIKDLVEVGQIFDIEQPVEILKEITDAVRTWSVLAKDHGVNAEVVKKIRHSHRYKIV